MTFDAIPFDAAAAHGSFRPSEAAAMRVRGAESVRHPRLLIALACRVTAIANGLPLYNLRNPEDFDAIPDDLDVRPVPPS